MSTFPHARTRARTYTILFHSNPALIRQDPRSITHLFQLRLIAITHHYIQLVHSSLCIFPLYFLKAPKIFFFNLSARPIFGFFAGAEEEEAAGAAAGTFSSLVVVVVLLLLEEDPADSGTWTTLAAPPRPVWKSPSMEGRVASGGTWSLSARVVAWGALLSAMFAAPVFVVDGQWSV